MKIEISIEKDDKKKTMEEDSAELMDEAKVAIGQKIKKNLALTRKERTLLAGYLLKDEES